MSYLKWIIIWIALITSQCAAFVLLPIIGFAYFDIIGFFVGIFLAVAISGGLYSATIYNSADKLLKRK